MRNNYLRNSDVSRDVTPRSRGVVYFCGCQKHDVAWCFFLNLLPKKRVRGENAGELLRDKLYKSVHKCIGNKFFLDFPKVNQSGPLGSMQFVGRIVRRPSPRESASCGWSLILFNEAVRDIVSMTPQWHHNGLTWSVMTNWYASSDLKDFRLSFV